MSEPDDLPRLPEDRIEQLPRKVSELRPGERVILHAAFNTAVDEEGHVWVDSGSQVMQIALIPALSLQAERTEQGFILWLDEKVKFKRVRLRHKNYLPVVEFRDAPQEEE